MTSPHASPSLHALPGPDDILRVELDNGITVLARENFTSPSVVVSGKLALGALLEPPEKAGLAAIHSALLEHGTERHSFNDFFEEIESVGASLDISSGNHSYGFGAKSLAEDLPLMLSLLAEAMRMPTFPEEYLEKVRGQHLTSLRMRAQSTRQMSSLIFNELAYPDHPYARSTNGYIETVQSITRDDIVDFQKHLGPAGAIVVVVGAIKPEEAVEQVRKVLGDWQNPSQPGALSVPDAVPPDSLRHRFTFIPGKAQADIVLGYPGPRRSHPDFQTARLANSILGVFGLYGRLGDNVREKQGLAYYCYSQLRGGKGPGPWTVNAGVAPENIERAIESIVEELRAITTAPVTQEEMDDNKSFFKGQLVLGLETNDGVAGAIMNMEDYGLGLDYLWRYADAIDSITREGIQEIARTYLNPDAYVVSIAGPEPR